MGQSYLRNVHAYRNFDHHLISHLDNDTLMLYTHYINANYDLALTLCKNSLTIDPDLKYIIESKDGYEIIYGFLDSNILLQDQILWHHIIISKYLQDNLTVPIVLYHDLSLLYFNIGKYNRSIQYSKKINNKEFELINMYYLAHPLFKQEAENFIQKKHDFDVIRLLIQSERIETRYGYINQFLDLYNLENKEYLDLMLIGVDSLVNLNHMIIAEKNLDRIYDLLIQQQLTQIEYITYVNAYVYLRLTSSKNPDKIKACLNMMIELTTNYELPIHLKNEVHDTLAWAYYKNGYYEDAIRILEEIMQDTSESIYVIHLSKCYNKSGEFEKAVRLCEKHLKFEPHNTDLLNELGDLFFNHSQFEKANLYWSELLRIDPSRNDIKKKLKIQ